jgi:hypothetical protein
VPTPDHPNTFPLKKDQSNEKDPYCCRSHRFACHRRLADDTASIKPIVGAFPGRRAARRRRTMRELANADYIQHNPFIPTGLEPFIELLPVLAEAGTTAENIRMFEDGNYRLHAQYLAQCRAVRSPRDGVLRHHPVDENGRSPNTGMLCSPS